jgi:hypothetical protein
VVDRGFGWERGGTKQGRKRSQPLLGAVRVRQYERRVELAVLLQRVLGGVKIKALEIEVHMLKGDEGGPVKKSSRTKS